MLEQIDTYKTWAVLGVVAVIVANQFGLFTGLWAKFKGRVASVVPESDSTTDPFELRGDLFHIFLEVQECAVANGACPTKINQMTLEEIGKLALQPRPAEPPE